MENMLNGDKSVYIVQLEVEQHEKNVGSCFSVLAMVEIKPKIHITLLSL
jgi:hypothetical protein